jgi:alanine racemase
VLSFPITAEVRADAIRANICAIRRRLPSGMPICAAVKASAYGHGIEHVLPVLAGVGVERIAVANLPEALQARELGWNKPILCLGSVLAAESERERIERARAVLASGLNCTVTTQEEARLLSAEAIRSGHPAHVEVKVDTGMGRTGVRVGEAQELIASVAALPGIILEGVYTHFATADESDPAFTRTQIERFTALQNALRRKEVPVQTYHSANSAAVFRHPEAHLDMVRPGLAVYGYWGGPEGERPDDLVPAMRVVGRLMVVRRLPANHAVGYGCTFRTTRESLIGVVPLGYADGYRRSLSNQAVMTLEAVRGQPRRTVPVVGRISMDQTTVDLTDAGDVRAGDRIVIIDDDPAAPNSVEALAGKLGTIPYEITCLLGQRVRRVLI